MTAINQPPPCPVCGGATRLKEIHRARPAEKVICFFRCVDCDTEYPRSLDATDVLLAGLMPHKAGDGERNLAAYHLEQPKVPGST